MARTYKDRFYCAYCEHSYEEQIGWGVGCSGVKNYLKKYTNRKMRHHKGFIKSGGSYKRMFLTTWDVW